MSLAWLPLVVAPLLGCDVEKGEGYGNKPGGETDGADGSDGAYGGDADLPDYGDDAVCVDPSVEGGALLDAARCEVWNGEVIAGCDSRDSLRRSCDEAFITWCNEQGADVVACKQEELPVQLTYSCSFYSPFDPSCTTRFFDACDSHNGVAYTADPTQLSGGCAVEPPIVEAKVSLCCSGTNSNGVPIGCDTNASTPEAAFDNCTKSVKILCEGGAGCTDGACECI